MFSNVGGKIKLVSKILCYVLIAFILIGSIILAISSGGLIYQNGALVSRNMIDSWSVFSYEVSPLMIILYGIIICVGIYFTSLLTYGFGQLIENTGSKKE